VTAGTIALPAAQAERPPVNKWLVTISITFGTLMWRVRDEENGTENGERRTENEE